MRHDWASRAGLARLAGVGVALLAVTVGAACPALADGIDDSFLSALNNAGFNVGNPADTVALGQSVCPMLEQSTPALAGPASSVANAVSGITGQSDMSPEMAEMFLDIAVPVYCPQMMSQISNGQLPDLSGIPGLSGGVPGLSGLGSL
ncbi:MAG TPA: DUF732 domain-containing protein [Mycobacterium sp.]|nr:DUF732 domain-containing protein [Mycobacterium sp.]